MNELNTLKAFTFDNNDNISPEMFEVRVVMRDDEPWFVARDVCDVLELQNTTVVMQALDDDERAKFNLGRQGNTWIINESGLYNIIMRSRKPEARRFRKWVTMDVLPTIRQHGAYMTPATLEESFEDPDFLIALVEKLKKTKLERDEAVRTKAHISDKKTATAMATASKYSKENRRLKEKYENPSMVAVKAIPWLKDYFQKIPGKKFPWSLIGADLKAISLEFGMGMQEIADQKYGTVKLYHQDAVALYKGRVENGQVREAVGKYLK